MKQIEIEAFNRGIETVLALAASAARAIRTAPDFRPPRDGFAAEALAALAEEGRALLIADLGADPVAEPLAPDNSGGGGDAVGVPIAAAAVE